MSGSITRLFWLNWELTILISVHRTRCYSAVTPMQEADSIKPKSPLANYNLELAPNNRSSRLMQYPFYTNTQIAFLHGFFTLFLIFYSCS